MKVAICGIIVAVLVYLVPGPVQGQEKKTVIIGWPPYIFGSDLTSLMQANSALQASCPTLPQDWTCLSAKVEAPIAGQKYSGMLGLFLIYEHLELIGVVWAFDDAVARGRASYALSGELRANYAIELFKGVRPLADNASVTVWTDVQGNVAMISDTPKQPTTLSLLYISARAARALAIMKQEGTPLPVPLPPAGY
jgi:hypothetical protein